MNYLLSNVVNPDKLDWEYISEFGNISLSFAEKCQYTIKQSYMKNLNIKTYIIKNKLYDKL